MQTAAMSIESPESEGRATATSPWTETAIAEPDTGDPPRRLRDVAGGGPAPRPPTARLCTPGQAPSSQKPCRPPRSHEGLTRSESRMHQRHITIRYPERRPWPRPGAACPYADRGKTTRRDTLGSDLGRWCAKKNIPIQRAATRGWLSNWKGLFAVRT
ncbi:hypothetical protein A0H81_08611 [Grifola frondosa]|uniref:Uncharacterized protein n=1 Tax=Grifola frondosa TaxID=5627 RepID=A0A1C7M3Z5_GRIFR|nr:hypothetical protein A0H81_08611 [Grifola frondosa]